MSIEKNIALVQTWLADDNDSDAATDRALRALLADTEHVLSPALARRHAVVWHDEYPHVAEVLRSLADKLHSE